MCAWLRGKPESWLLNSVNGVTLPFHLFLRNFLIHCLFPASLGLRCCGRACSSFGDRSLIAAALLVAERAQWWGRPGSGAPWHMESSPGPGIRPMSPA